MKPLKPVMAALLAAASATFASPGTAFAAPPKKSVAAEEDCLKTLDVAETDPVNALTCLIQKKPQARKDIGERLAAFIQGKDPGRQYLTDELLKDAEKLKLAVTAAKGWPEATITAKKAPGNVAVLYFVIGPESDSLPEWAQVKALKGKLKPKMTWSDRLAIGLTSDHWSDTKRVSQQNTANDTTAFLNAAVIWANKVMDDVRKTNELNLSIAHNNVTDKTPVFDPGVGGRNNRNRATFGAGFTTAELYGQDPLGPNYDPSIPPIATVAHVYGPKDDGYRVLSMKIYTVRNDDGGLQNMIGVVDITDPNAPYKPQFIPVTATGKQELTLRSGGRAYEVNIDGDSITLTREGVKPGEGSLTASMSNLYGMRADQARSAGKVRVPDPDGAEYYVISQGNVVPGAPRKDARGDLVLFPKDVIENPQTNPRLLRPASICSVRMVDKDGVTVPVTWNPDLGMMPDGLNPDGSRKMSPFHMYFDAKDGMWKAARNAGDPDPAKPKPAPAAATNTTAGVNPSSTTAPATGGTVTTDPTKSPTAGMATLDQIVAWAKQVDPPWNDGDNAHLSPDLAKKLHIMTAMHGDKRVFCVFFDPSMGVPGNQYAFPEFRDDTLKMVRGAGKYVALVFEKAGPMYYDAPNFAKFVSGKEGVHVAYTWAETPGIQKVDDLEVVLDMLTFYKKVSPKPEPAALRKNVEKFAGKGPFEISSNSDTKDFKLTMKYGKDLLEAAEVWPHATHFASDRGTNDGLTDQKGPGTIYTLAGGGTGTFQKTVSEGAWTTDGGGEINEAAGYALYVGKEPSIDKDSGVTTMRKRYAIMIRYKKLKDGDPVLSKLITIFGDHGDPDYFAKPADLHLTGYPNEVLGDTSLLRMFADTTAKDGAISAYRTPASVGNARDPYRNCVGPVVWWGIDKSQAIEHCQKDSKTPD